MRQAGCAGRGVGCSDTRSGSLLSFFAVSEQLWHACERFYAFDVLRPPLSCLLSTPPRQRNRRGYRLIFIFAGADTCLPVLPSLLPIRRRAFGKAAPVRSARNGHALGRCGVRSACHDRVAGSFLLLLGPVHAATGDSEIVSCWTNAFSDWQRPWDRAGLTLSTPDVFRYCCKPLGQFLAGLTVLEWVLLPQATGDCCTVIIPNRFIRRRPSCTAIPCRSRFGLRGAGAGSSHLRWHAGRVDWLRRCCRLARG